MRTAEILLMLVLSVAAQADAVTDALARAKRPELPHVAAGIVKTNPATRPTIIRWVASHRPAALDAVQRTLAENRPPTTPGNEHGKRPTVPPGNHYGTP